MCRGAGWGRGSATPAVASRGPWGGGDALAGEEPRAVALEMRIATVTP